MTWDRLAGLTIVLANEATFVAQSQANEAGIADETALEAEKLIEIQRGLACLTDRLTPTLDSASGRPFSLDGKAGLRVLQEQEGGGSGDNVRRNGCDRVAGSCRTGTLLFLTVSTGAMIPSKPARITITHDGRLCYRSAIDSQSIPNPHVSPNALERMMPGFRLLHSFLLGEQMQEFLFSYA